MDSHVGADQSLEEIDGTSWGDPPADATRLVATVHRLRRLPIGRLDIEGLRLLIGQHEGLDVLVPLALDALKGIRWLRAVIDNATHAGHFAPSRALQGLGVADVADRRLPPRLSADQA